MLALPEPSRSLAWLLVLTGLRIGELLALRWCDIDFELGCLRVRQTVYEGRFDDPKTQRSKRTVPLGAKGIAIFGVSGQSDFKPEALVFATSSRYTFQPKKPCSIVSLSRRARSSASRVSLGIGCDMRMQPCWMRWEHPWERCRSSWGTPRQRSRGGHICIRCQRRLAKR